MAIQASEVNIRAVEVLDLSKRFGRTGRSRFPWRKGKSAKQALDRVSLRVDRAGITGILGANGSGKSTLIRILAGLDSPTSGAVLLDGAEVRGPGLVFVDGALWQAQAADDSELVAGEEVVVQAVHGLQLTVRR